MKTSIISINGTEIVRKKCNMNYTECPAANLALGTDNIRGVYIDTNRETNTEEFGVGVPGLDAKSFDAAKKSIQAMCRCCSRCCKVGY